MRLIKWLIGKSVSTIMRRVDTKQGIEMHCWRIWKPLTKIGLNCFVHRIVDSEPYNLYHTHPGLYISLMLSGGYDEYLMHSCIHRRPGHVTFRNYTTPHFVRLRSKEAWTLFIGFFPKFETPFLIQGDYITADLHSVTDAKWRRYKDRI